MKFLVFLIVCIIVFTPTTESTELTVPYAMISSPVVHAGRYQILSCKDTYVVLDSSRGMSICMIGHGPLAEKGLDIKTAVLTNGSLKASMMCGGELIDLDQSFDTSARLQIIDQSSERVAARVYFTLRSENGFPYGSGSLDLYIYEGRIYFAPSIYIDYEKGGTLLTKAGFCAHIPGENAEMIVNGAKLMPTDTARFFPFDNDTEDFNLTVNNPGRFSMKIGWLRNANPTWLYMNNIAINPEVDELYEKWPPWITQRGNPLTWKVTPNSGLLAGFSKYSLNRLEYLWINGDSLDVPEGGYKALNGIMALFLASDSSEAQNLWRCHGKPLKPEVTVGDFKYYNEIEGVYEIDSKGGNIEVTFDNISNSYPHEIFVRIWNLSGSGAFEIKANNKSVPFALFNDGDIIEDPMVAIVKQAKGSARYANVAFTAQKGTKTRLTMKSTPGIQFTYQMYSNLETYEAWSDVCEDKPLFRFHLSRGEIYTATLPGKDKYAFFKLPLYWLKNGVNTNTFMNHTRGFTINVNGPDHLQFTYTGVNLQGTGLSKYMVTVPYELDILTIEVKAEFVPLDDGRRWTSIEYCDLYPFDNVYRREFHYDDVIFLNRFGEFERVGTGAWGGGFITIMEPERLGYYAEPVAKDGPGTRTPHSTDGTVWILGNNPLRGNILYHRGAWTPSPGAQSVLSLCNAWVDIHNTITNRQEPGAGETISYIVEVFGGDVSSLDRLNAMYQKAAGEKTVKQIAIVNYSQEGEIEGFIVK